MNRKYFSAWLLALLVMLAALPVRQAAAAESIGYDFEKSLNPWSAASNREECVNSKTLQLAVEESVSAGPGKNQFAALTSICGSNTFMVARLVTDATEFTIQFDARRVAGCEGCIPLLYVGAEMPRYPGQFTTDFTSISDKWQANKYAIRLNGDTRGKVVVALAFVNLDAQGNGPNATVGFDNIQITPVIEKCLECD